MCCTLLESDDTFYKNTTMHKTDKIKIEESAKVVQLKMDNIETTGV